MSRRKKLIIGTIILITIFIIVYLYAMLIGAKRFKIKEYKIENSNIPEEYNDLRIVHMSDLHYGISINEKELKNIIKEINKLEPDLIFFTGDLVDDKITKKQHKEIVNCLKKLKANIGMYIVNGNHDYFYKKWDELVEETPFININDNYDIVYKDSYNSISISGISDNIYSKKKIKNKTKIIFDYLNSEEAKNNVYNILLMHEPDYVEDIDYSKFDLILSGHSHNGQVKLPILGVVYTPIGSKKYYKEYYKLNDTDLYISSGIGTTLLPIRLNNRPSVNFYRLIKKEN